MSLKPLTTDPSLSDEARRIGERINRGVEKALSYFCKRKYGKGYFLIRRYSECEWWACDETGNVINVKVQLSPVPSEDEYRDSQGYFLKVTIQGSLLNDDPKYLKDAEEFCDKITQATHIPVNYHASGLYGIKK